MKNELKDMKTICVVGHGPSPVGKGLGNIIDQHEGVLRMVECDWQNIKDYGRKYTVGIYSDGPDDKWRMINQHKPDVYFFYPTRGENLEKQPDEFKENAIVLKESVWRWIKLMNLQAHHFSRGTAAVLGAVRYFHPQEITLVGFDAVQNGYNLNHHPTELTQHTQHHPAKGGNTHDWAAEKQVLNILNMYTKIRYI